MKKKKPDPRTKTKYESPDDDGLKQKTGKRKRSEK